MTIENGARPGGVGGRILDNPFYVLGVRPDATRAVVEREGQKLLGMLALGLKSSMTYATPAGRGERTETKVRQAMAELREPERRLAHELWARLEPPKPRPVDTGEDASEVGVEKQERADVPFDGALEALGWRRA